MNPIRRKRKRVSIRAVTAVLPGQAASGGIPSDVLGSYTGHALDGDRPIQDADDL